MIRDLTTESLTLTRLRSGWVIIELNGRYRLKPSKDRPGHTLSIAAFGRIKHLLTCSEIAGLKIYGIMTQDQIDKAKSYHLRHFQAVERKVALAQFGVSPSREDQARPELWKGIHWRWFVENH